TDERGRGIDAAAQGLRGIFRRQRRRGNKLVEGLVVDCLEIVGLFERGAVRIQLRQPRVDERHHLAGDIFGRIEIGRRGGDLFDVARAWIWPEAELEKLRGEIFHRRDHVYVEGENDSVE